jgi:hypothetical protein
LRPLLKRKKYFDTVDVDEIERQLACGSDEDEGGQDAVDQKPERLTYQLPERENLVRLFFDSPRDIDEDAAFERRKKAMLLMEALCQRREAPRAIALQIRQKEVARPDVIAPEEPPSMIIGSRRCLFCIGRKGVEQREAMREFASDFSAQRHTQRMHLQYLNK